MGKEGRKHIYQAASSGRGNMGNFFQSGNQGNSHTRLLNERGVSYSFFGLFIASHVFVSADVQVFIGPPSCTINPNRNPDVCPLLPVLSS
jgi:hypothetical protein